MYELLGERTAADNEKPAKKKEKKEKPAKVEVGTHTCFIYFVGTPFLLDVSYNFSPPVVSLHPVG